MEALNNKRARLRRELQQAYDVWMDAGVRQSDQPADGICIDISGSREAAKPQWFEYLAAKHRLILAYAEQFQAA